MQIYFSNIYFWDNRKVQEIFKNLSATNTPEASGAGIFRNNMKTLAISNKDNNVDTNRIIINHKMINSVPRYREEIKPEIGNVLGWMSVKIDKILLKMFK